MYINFQTIITIGGVLSAVLSLLTSVAGLPEVQENYND